MKLCIVFFCVCVGMASAMVNSLSKGFTGAEKQHILDYHNEIRSKVAMGNGLGNQPQAANMMPMEWNDDLAKTAQGWADTCDGSPHDPAANRIVGTTFATAGQNMMPCTHGRHDCMDEGMKAFYDEASGFNYDTEGCTAHMCSHFTQLSWADSRYVGCGYNWCPNSIFARLICNYGPGGNFASVKAYVKGPTCSQCPKPAPYCLKGLCSTKDECHKSRTPSECKCTIEESQCTASGGTFDSANCVCKCSHGSGRLCNEACDDNPAYAGAGCDMYKNYGYCAASSPYYPVLKTVCPKTCGMCDNLSEFSSDPALSVNPERKESA